jgi:hypothetical protein
MSNNFLNIPAEMRDTPHWIVWRLEMKPDKSGELKPSKTPYSVNGGYGKVNDAATWASFMDALTAYEKGKYNGLGFVFTDTPFVAVDIDGCISDDGKVTKTAHDITARLNSYTECSQSGHGLHIIVKGKLPAGRRRNGAVEMYGDGSSRYFAMTGDTRTPAVIRECQTDIDHIHRQYIQPEETKQTAIPRPSQSVGLDDSALIEKACNAKNGAAFAALWRGDTSAHGGDDSAADQALCNHLAFWTGRDAARIDSLFRQSGLMRPKWDRKQAGTTYGAITINKAVTDCNNVYEPRAEYSVSVNAEVSRGNNVSPNAPPASPEQTRPTVADVGSSRSSRSSSGGSGIPLKLDTTSAISLWNTDLPPLKFVVKDMLPQGLSILAAPSKYGKSWLSLDLCLSVASGESFLNRETEKSCVLYLALEDGYRRLKKRMGQILKGKTPPEGLDFAIKSNTIDSGLSDQVNAYLKEKPETGLVIIDVLQRVRSSGGKGTSAYALDYADMGALKAIADAHQICVLVIHHLRKMTDDADPFNMISGTNGIMGAADTIFLLCKKERADKEATLKMIGRDIETADLIVEFDPDISFKWRVMGTVDERRASNERSEYENDPIIKTIQGLLFESPAGVEITASEFMTVMMERTGEMTSPEKIGRAFKSNTEKLFNYDRIIYKPGNSKTRKHSFTKHEPKIVPISGQTEAVQGEIEKSDDDLLPI